MPRLKFVGLVCFAVLTETVGSQAQTLASPPGDAPQVQPQQPSETERPRVPQPLPRVPGVMIPERAPVEQEQPGFGGGCRYQPRNLELIV